MKNLFRVISIIVLLIIAGLVSLIDPRIGIFGGSTIVIFYFAFIRPIERNIHNDIIKKKEEEEKAKRRNIQIILNNKDFKKVNLKNEKNIKLFNYTKDSYYFNEIKKFINNNLIDINSQDSTGKTPLMYAAIYNDDIETINFLLNQGADVSIKDNKGKTALIYASKFNWPSIIKSILKYGPNLKTTDSNGKSAKYYTIQNDKLDYKFIKNNFKGDDKYFVASKNGNCYHYLDCSSIVQLIASNNEIRFDSVQEAKENGYEPCEICIPPSNF